MINYGYDTIKHMNNLIQAIQNSWDPSTSVKWDLKDQDLEILLGERGGALSKRDRKYLLSLIPSSSIENGIIDLYCPADIVATEKESAPYCNANTNQYFMPFA